MKKGPKALLLALPVLFAILKLDLIPIICWFVQRYIQKL